MDKEIKNEEVNEETVNENVEEQETAAEEQTDAADTQKEEKKELTPEEKIAELEKQVEELKNQQLYKVAEFDNFRKRVMQEKADLIKNGGAKVITTLLPIIDDLERAQQNMDNYEDVEAVKEGLNLIIDKFFKLLAQEGLKKMDVVGQPFDSDLHEAIAMVPGQPDEQKGKVMDCLTAGYTLNDKVIRYAKVAVAE
ncbi:MAG: nucleotide exchange factor GrpE [Bacteroidaceae bacterium]|jgi:molecular chaperone GrpE|nr:nucleotide exchange factor GrpE [Bacteroidaceae bacterium]MBR6973750.1 nucleotide exchange factor GrpE [Bacteroidaceae bacterium]MCR5043734.1 nucleotide exchange factor GrpE [Bacteroidaceae bacterium]MDO4201237.1 nucleotide exchange factor GrpE [Bacteroidales bacterium]